MTGGHPNPPNAADQPTQLHRALGFWTLTAFGVGDILGAGIYALVGKVVGSAGELAWLAFFVTLSVALLTALSYAELSTRFSRSGGEAYFCQQAFGWQPLALLIGYLVFASGTVSMATVAHGFSGYLGAMLGQNAPRWIVIPCFLAALGGIAYWGIRQSSTVNVVCTLVEVGGLLFVIVVGCMFLLSGEKAAEEVVQPHADWNWLGVLQGGALAFFAFIGFEDMVNVAEEVKQPARTMPAAILTALAVAAAIYMAVTWVATSVVPVSVLSSSKAPLLEVVRRAAPGVSDGYFTGVALFAVANTALLNLVMGSRLLYGMAGQGLLPRSLHVVHKKRKSPHRTIFVVLIVGLALALSGTLRHLAGTTNALLLIVFFTVNLSLIALRLRGEPSPANRFRLPLVVPALGAVTCLAMTVFLPRKSLATAAALIVVGLMLVGVWRWRGRSLDV